MRIGKMSVNWAVIGGTLGGILATVAVRFCYKLWLRLQARKAAVDLRGKTVLITGASSGLGEACAKVFFEHGCHLILTGRNMEKLQEVEQDLCLSLDDTGRNVPKSERGSKEPLPPSVTLMRMDLEDVAGLQQAAEKMGKVDVVVSNAGISYRGCIEDSPVRVDQKLMAVNYLGHVALIKGLLGSMLRENAGHIVGISSIQGRIAIPYRSAYAASKHAFQAFFDCLRAELADANIQVSVVSPGYIRTNLSLNAIRGDGTPHGVMDQTTEEGMAPEAVARRVVQCVVGRESEVVLAPCLHRFAIVLRAVAPNLYFALMAKRARKQRDEYKITKG
ncbi:hypothetical protein ACOMHN_015791 [Nucella lapillus]